MPLNGANTNAQLRYIMCIRWSLVHDRYSAFFFFGYVLFCRDSVLIITTFVEVLL